MHLGHNVVHLCERRIFISFQIMSIDSNSRPCPGTVLSPLKNLFSFSCQEFPLCWKKALVSLLLTEPSMIFAISLSIGFAFPLPTHSSILSKSHIMSISLNIFAFAFGLLVDDIKSMRECIILIIDFYFCYFSFVFSKLSSGIVPEPPWAVYIYPTEDDISKFRASCCYK